VKFWNTPLLLCLLTATLSAQNSTGWVVIPVSEYGTLRGRAFPAAREPEAPSLEAILTRVDYDLRINGDLAAGRASLTVDVLKDGWVRLPIPDGLLVRDAKMEGHAASLLPGEGGRQLTAVLQKRGRSVLLLDVALPVVTSAAEEKLSLPASTSGVTRAAVVLPRQGVEIQVSGGILSSKSESAPETHWVAYGSDGAPLAFTWRRKTEDHRITLPLRLRGTLTELVGLGDDASSVYAQVDLEVAQGAAAQVKMELPDAVTVNQVLGATVADWEAKGGQLTVKFLEPEEHAARFMIAGEARLPRDGAVEIPLLRLRDTERESGGVAIEVVGAGELKDLKPEGLERVDASELGQLVSSRQSPSLMAFRFRPSATPRSLAVSVARYEQQAVLTANIEEARYRVLMTLEGKTLVHARYAIRNSQRNFVRVKLPEGAAMWNASLSGRPVLPGLAADGGLLFPVEKARAGEEAPAFAIEILYVLRGDVWSEKGRASLLLPALDVPVSRTGLMLYYPPVFRVNAEPGSFRVKPFEEATSNALSGEAAAGGAEESAPAHSAQNDLLQQFNSNAAQAATQALVDKFKSRSDGRNAAGTQAAGVAFPAVGPTMFLASELTEENQGPTIVLSYQKEKKGGVQ
jgi:hypothetical protein